MPLSEHEQRLLDQIERALYAEDPKFASAVRATDPRHRARRRFVLSVAFFMVGVVLLFVGVILGSSVGTAVGLAGFLIMFGAAVSGVASWRRMHGAEPPKVLGHRRAGRKSQSPPRRSPSRGASRGASRGTGRPRRGSVLDRLEQRWRRRDGNRGF